MTASRRIARTTAALAALMLPVIAGQTAAADGPARVLRVVPQSDLTVIDPMFGSAWISLISGEMIWESLFTWDSKLSPKPMMVRDWSVSPDGLVWRFTLRDGLRFHSGEPVTTDDVIVSTRRWMALDAIGAKLQAVLDSMTAVDDRTFEMRLKRPFPIMLTALAAAPAHFPAVMRAKDIEADGKLILSQVNNAIGSGPFRFVPDERNVGHLAVWARNADYTPRAEAPDGLSGARIVKVDRVEWHVIPDAATAAAALQAGEVDMLERPVLDQVEALARLPGVRILKLTPIMAQNMLRPNATIPPFDNPKMRLALAYVIDQRDEMAAGWGDESHWKTCNSYFICGSPYGTEAGATDFHQDFAKARQIAADAGYKGEKLIFVSTKEIPTLGQMAEVAYDALKRAGFNVEMQWGDWGTVGQILRKKDGWNLFLTGAPGAVMYHPLINIATDMTCGGLNFVGWACDPKAEELRAAFLNADEATSVAALDHYHRYLAEVQPYRVLGQYDALSAIRTNVSGLLESPVIAYWNVEKTAP
jgi:peptide/nickel transport system substrate-binding protein